MPTYEYACRECGEHLEVVQSFTDDSLTVCPNCGGELRKVFGSVGIVFKGSGFYKNDSRSKPGASKVAEPAAAKADSAPSTGEATPAKTESKPTETKSTSTDSKPAAAAAS